MFEIIPADEGDAEHLVLIISEANKDVAQQFDITMRNAPKHPSFCTKAWVLSGLERGEEYFLYKDGEVLAGCVAFEQPDMDTAYLNRLSVMPKYRHNGIGSALVRYVLDYSKTRNVQTVSIGIIADHVLLKRWYSGLGFVEVNNRKFEHLPFDVKYMKYDL
jgi:ribosomal protein S18 acetylase RimI-like enzyme